jgi:hypothetical protein
MSTLPDSNKKYREWEYIASETMRLKIYGGWLVRYAQSNNMVFIPDASHRWEWIQDKDGDTRLREAVKI